MGTSKQLLPLAHKPAILHCLHTLLRSTVDHVLVVLARGNETVADAIRDEPVGIVWNPDPELGMMESVWIGLGAVPPQTSGILVCLADQPLVRPGTVTSLCTHHRIDRWKIHLPLHQGRPGHPVLFPRHLLEDAEPGQTMRDVIHGNEVAVCGHELPDEGVLLDMDTPGDYLELCRRMDAELRVEKGRGYLPDRLGMDAEISKERG